MPILLTDHEMGIVMRGLMLAEREAAALGDDQRAATCQRLLKAIVSYHDMQIELERRPRT